MRGVLMAEALAGRVGRHSAPVRGLRPVRKTTQVFIRSNREVSP